jgi:hypothetical protein
VKVLQGLSPVMKAIGGLVGIAAAVVSILVAFDIIGGGSDALGAAVDKTIDAGSSRVTLEMSGEGENPFSFSGAGEMDFRRSRGRLNYDYSAMGGPSEVEAIIVGSTFYFRPADRSRLPEGKTWVRVSISDLVGEKAGSVQIGLLPLGQDDPSRLLEMLRETGDAKEVGEERLFGGATTHYHGEIDREKFVEYASSEKGTMTEENARTLLQDVQGAIPFDIWVDSDGLVRREAVAMRSKVEGETITISAAVDLFDFGIEVDAEAPPAEAVVDISDVPDLVRR